jgi:Fic/DOC family
MFQRRIKRGYTRPRKAFKPLELQYFSPALVAQYIPETLSSNPDEVSDENLFLMLFVFWQHEDIYRALAYSEQEVIPQLRAEQRQHLTPEKIIAIIKNVHARAAATLFLDINQEPGQYTTGEVMRWHYTREFSAALHAVILQEITLAQMLKHYGLEALQGTLDKLIKKIVALKVDIPTSAHSSNMSDVAAWRLKLYYGYHQNQFTPDEIELIEKLVIICMLPDQVPAAMDAFAKILCERIQACTGEEDEVVSIAAFAFQQLTSIHCFSNGNGRTATNIMNDLLIAFELPSIVMRTQSEADDTASSYSLALKYMDKDIGYLEKHIKLKLQEARKVDLQTERNGFRAQLTKMEEGLIYCYALLDVHRMHLGNANFNLLALHCNELKSLGDRWNHYNAITTPYNGLTFQFSQQSHQQPDALTAVNHLKYLTRIKTGWKHNSKNPKALNIWLQDLPQNDLKAAFANLQDVLKDTSAVVTMRKIANSDKYIVKVDDLTLAAVLAIEQPSVRKKKL